MNVNNAEEFDVAITGAGPAGSAAAIRLARAGLRVVLVERANFPREKLCGEFVSPECVRHFMELGLASLATADHPHIESTIFYSQRGRSVEFQSGWFGTGVAALGISRAEMDETMLECARRAGADVRMESTVLGVDVNPSSGVTLRFRSSNEREGHIRAKYAIDATGRKRVLGPEAASRVRASKVAFKTHLRDAPVSRSRCEIYSYSGGYGGCNAIGANRFNLCFIVDTKLVKAAGGDGESVMRSVLFRNAAARRTLEQARFDEPWLAVPVDGFGRRPTVYKDRVLFVGDSAAFIDPFTGSGILLALQSAEMCANALIDGIRERLSPGTVAAGYKRNHEDLLAGRLLVSSLLRPASSSPRLAEVVLALISRSERLRAALARATRFSGASGV